MGDAFALGAFLLVGLTLALLIMPIIAVVSARRARRQVEVLRIDVDAMQRELTELRRAVRGVPSPPSRDAWRAPVAAPPAREPVAAPEAAPIAARDAAPPEIAAREAVAATENAAAATAVNDAASVASEAASAAAATATSDAATAATAASAAATAANVATDTATAATATAAREAAAEAPPPTASADAPPASLEERIALVWFTRIGAAVLLLGVAWFYKYAVDNNWIGPLGRVALGALAGAGVLVAAEALRPRTRTIYVQVLAGVGLALLYVSAYAAHAFYHLIPAPAAFAAIGVVTLLGGALAIHHNGEAILVLALIAGLLSPVLLSTGEDRPGALFGYLFVLTSLAFYTSLRMKFRWATWLAIAGPPLLFIGWYAKFFDVRAQYEVYPEGMHRGVYFGLVDRAAPLIAVAAFFAQWVAVYTIARRRELTRLWPLAILCVAALGSHAGFAALLYDHPLHLGAVLAALAVASSYLFGRENRRELLLLPLGAAFFVLVGTLHGTHRHDVLGVMAMLALWGAIYARSFLDGQLGEGRKPSPFMLWAVSAVGVAVAIAAAVLLAEPHPAAFAIALAVLSLLYASLAVATVTPVMAVAAAVLTLAGVGLAEAQGPTDARFIAVAAVWAAVYLASVAWDVLKRGAPPTALRLVTFSVAGLGFALMAETQTVEKEWLARAGILAAVGVVDLAFGAALLAKKRGDGAASLILGQALALFAGAFAFVFSGATLTLVWAAMAAVVAVLAAEREDNWWLAGAASLFVVALSHLVAVDVNYATTQRSLFWATNGKQGLARLPVLLNERAYALAGTAVALLVAARAVGRRSKKLFTVGGAILLSVGHWLVLTLLISETNNAVVHTPTPPKSMDPAELQQFIAAFDQALWGAEQQMRMMTTLVMGAYAALLVGIGFGLRERMHRYLGLGLFALTLLKLSLYDIWKLPRVYQMLVFLAVGVLLLGASFLYARFGKRLFALIRDGSVKTALIIFALVAPRQAHAFDATQLLQSRPLDGVTAPGLYRVEVDPALYRAARSESLDDVRIAAPDGGEVPWLMRRVPPPAVAVTHAVTLVDPVTLPDGSARATLDLGAPGLKHSEVQLELAGSGDFFRKTRIESSSDEQSWALLTEGAYVFRVDGGERTLLTYPLSDARYLRVTLLPAAGPRSEGNVRITGASTAFNPVEAQAPMRALPPLTPVPLPSEKGQTSWLLDLGAAGLPVAEVQLDVGNAEFERHAQLYASTQKAYWVPAGATLLYRVATGKQREENLALPAGGTRKQYLKLTIVNGDDAPLELRGARAAFAAEELVFRAPAAGTYTLYVGGDLPAPSYDLAAVMARANEQPTARASFGPLSANAKHADAPLPPPPLSERYRVPIGIALSVLLAGLALWTLRLLRRSKGDA